MAHLVFFPPFIDSADQAACPTVPSGRSAKRRHQSCGSRMRPTTLDRPSASPLRLARAFHGEGRAFEEEKRVLLLQRTTLNPEEEAATGATQSMPYSLITLNAPGRPAEARPLLPGIPGLYHRRERVTGRSHVSVKVGNGRSLLKCTPPSGGRLLHFPSSSEALLKAQAPRSLAYYDGAQACGTFACPTRFDEALCGRPQSPREPPSRFARSASPGRAPFPSSSASLQPPQLPPTVPGDNSLFSLSRLDTRGADEFECAEAVNRASSRASIRGTEGARPRIPRFLTSPLGRQEAQLERRFVSRRVESDEEGEEGGPDRLPSVSRPVGGSPLSRRQPTRAGGEEAKPRGSSALPAQAQRLPTRRRTGGEKERQLLRFSSQAPQVRETGSGLQRDGAKERQDFNEPEFPPSRAFLSRRLFSRAAPLKTGSANPQAQLGSETGTREPAKRLPTQGRSLSTLRSMKTMERPADPKGRKGQGRQFPSSHSETDVDTANPSASRDFSNEGRLEFRDPSRFQDIRGKSMQSEDSTDSSGTSSPPDICWESDGAEEDETWCRLHEGDGGGVDSAWAGSCFVRFLQRKEDSEAETATASLLNLSKAVRMELENALRRREARGAAGPAVVNDPLEGALRGANVWGEGDEADEREEENEKTAVALGRLVLEELKFVRDTDAALGRVCAHIGVLLQDLDDRHETHERSSRNRRTDEAYQGWLSTVETSLQDAIDLDKAAEKSPLAVGCSEGYYPGFGKQRLSRSYGPPLTVCPLLCVQTKPAHASTSPLSVSAGFSGAKAAPEARVDKTAHLMRPQAPEEAEELEGRNEGCLRLAAPPLIRSIRVKETLTPAGDGEESEVQGRPGGGSLGAGRWGDTPKPVRSSKAWAETTEDVATGEARNGGDTGLPSPSPVMSGVCTSSEGKDVSPGQKRQSGASKEVLENGGKAPKLSLERRDAADRGRSGGSLQAENSQTHADDKCAGVHPRLPDAVGCEKTLHFMGLPVVATAEKLSAEQRLALREDEDLRESLERVHVLEAYLQSSSAAGVARARLGAYVSLRRALQSLDSLQIKEADESEDAEALDSNDTATRKKGLKNEADLTIQDLQFLKGHLLAERARQTEAWRHKPGGWEFGRPGRALPGSSSPPPLPPVAALLPGSLRPDTPEPLPSAAPSSSLLPGDKDPQSPLNRARSFLRLMDTSFRRERDACAPPAPSCSSSLSSCERLCSPQRIVSSSVSRPVADATPAPNVKVSLDPSISRKQLGISVSTSQTPFLSTRTQFPTSVSLVSSLPKAQESAVTVSVASPPSMASSPSSPCQSTRLSSALSLSVSSKPAAGDFVRKSSSRLSTSAGLTGPESPRKELESTRSLKKSVASTTASARQSTRVSFVVPSVEPDSPAPAAEISAGLGAVGRSGAVAPTPEPPSNSVSSPANGDEAVAPTPEPPSRSVSSPANEDGEDTARSVKVSKEPAAANPSESRSVRDSAVQQDSATSHAPSLKTSASASSGGLNSRPAPHRAKTAGDVHASHSPLATESLRDAFRAARAITEPFQNSEQDGSKKSEDVEKTAQPPFVEEARHSGSAESPAPQETIEVQEPPATLLHGAKKMVQMLTDQIVTAFRSGVPAAEEANFELVVSLGELKNVLAFTDDKVPKKVFCVVHYQNENAQDLIRARRQRTKSCVVKELSEHVYGCDINQQVVLPLRSQQAGIRVTVMQLNLDDDLLQSLPALENFQYTLLGTTPLLLYSPSKPDAEKTFWSLLNTTDPGASTGELSVGIRRQPRGEKQSAADGPEPAQSSSSLIQGARQEVPATNVEVASPASAESTENKVVKVSPPPHEDQKGGVETGEKKKDKETASAESTENKVVKVSPPPHEDQKGGVETGEKKKDKETASAESTENKVAKVSPPPHEDQKGGVETGEKKEDKETKKENTAADENATPEGEVEKRGTAGNCKALEGETQHEGQQVAMQADGEHKKETEPEEKQSKE
ncbi:UNVERIFIED_CONTAM: hypothetical protein HHA_234270 [Hammondia hammondi]|eukprot:XP_008881674.1 hypothetical protein HHA_234270 [Hammondia hammondi]